MRKLVGVFLTAAFVAMTLTGPGATAHFGSGSAIFNLGESGYLQAESYGSLKDGCDPAPDGDHTLVTSLLGASAARIPYAHCMIAWWDVKTSHATEFVKFRLRVEDITGFASTDNQQFLVRVWSDYDWTNNNMVAEGLATLAPADGYIIFPFTTSVVMPVSYSYRTIKVEAIPQGSTPANANVHIDWIQHKGKCLNAAPFLNSVSVDGMVDGLIGWTNVDQLTGDLYDYTFQINGAHDPNNDPFEIVIEWGDGLANSVITSDEYAQGVRSVTRSFDLTDPTALVPEVVSFVVSIVDDPTLRCLEDAVDALYRSLPLQFVVVPDLLSDLLSPLAGFSCHDGILGTTWTQSGIDTIFGECPTTGRVLSAGFPPGSIQGDMRVGGVTFGSARATEIAFDYDATRFGEGLQDLQACFYVPTDKYDRDFCSGAYLFENKHCTNSPPLFLGLTGDGMVDGLHAWLGLPYTLQANIVDPDGDAVTVEWVWEDQPSDFGTSATRSFYTAGAHPFTLRLTEDLSGRCLDAPTEEVLVHGNMVMAVEDWTAILRFPREGMSCVGDRYVPTWIGFEQDVMAASCSVLGAVEIAAPGMDSVVSGSFLLDGQTIWQGTSRAITTTYNSLQYETEEKTLTACFEANGDKYGRIFCSAPFEFLNIGR